MCVLTNSTHDVTFDVPVAQYAATGQIARMKFDSDHDDVNNISIVLEQGDDSSVAAKFELYDITVVYNYMGVK